MRFSMLKATVAKAYLCAQKYGIIFRSQIEESTMNALNERIEINPVVCHGRPVVRDPRINGYEIIPE